MKISKTTLNLLSSFVKLNPSILIKKGSRITTTNVGKENNRLIPIKSVLVSVDVIEEFQNDFAIYDLKQFLDVIDAFNEPDFLFNDTFVEIKENNHSIKYAFVNPKVVLVPNTDSLILEKDKEFFLLDPKTLATLKKMSIVLKHDDLFIRNAKDKKSIELVLTTVTDGSDEHFNEFVVSIDKEVESEFNIQLSMKNIGLVIIDKNVYNARISPYGGKDILVLEGTSDTKIIYYFTGKRNKP